MTVNELKKWIVLSKDIPYNLLVFYGDDYYIQRVYISKIAEIKESDIEYIESLAEVGQSAGSSLFAFKRCFVCIDNGEITKSSDFDRDFNEIAQHLGNNTLILQFTKMDKKSKLYNYLSKLEEFPFKSVDMVEFNHLHTEVIQEHLMKELDILKPTAKKLAEVCEFDYGRCLLELDKVKNYTLEQPDKAFKVLLDKGIIYEPPGDKIFSFVDAVLGNQTRVAFDLLQECKDIGEPSLRLLSVLYNSIKHLLQVQSCERDIEQTTGLQSWEIRNLSKFRNIYKNSELVNAMRLIRDTEKGIKVGKIDESIAVEYVLVNIL